MAKTPPARLRANDKYKKEKCRNVSLQFSPKDRFLYEHLCNCGEPKMTYIKRLIREDMERTKQY